MENSSIVEDLVSTNQMVRPARINSFLLHRLLIHGEYHTFLLVYLSWFKFHPGMLQLGKPLTVWCSTVFEIEGIHSRTICSKQDGFIDNGYE